MTEELKKLRHEFVSLARGEGANVAEVCRRFQISRVTGYKWLKRAEGGGLEDASRRPKSSPWRTEEKIVRRILELRRKHPAWGPRKLKRRLEDLGEVGMPAASTFGAILLRAGVIEAGESLAHERMQRFERGRANELWQMDFKGDFGLSRGGRCHPLPLIDDHSRYLIGLFACGDQRRQTVQGHLQVVFERYGLPEEVLCDNGSPWAGPGGEWTGLGVWMLRQGIRLVHGRPYHPQTQGKEERLNRSLKAEVLRRQDLRDLKEAQRAFDEWREIYNHERPHEALELAVPAQRYALSARRYRPRLEPIEYATEDTLKKVKTKGEITWQNRTYFIGQAFAGEWVALRRTKSEEVYEIFYCHQKLGEADLRLKTKSKNHYLPIRSRRIDT
jgi:transposase InsO family protein